MVQTLTIEFIQDHTAETTQPNIDKQQGLELGNGLEIRNELILPSVPRHFNFVVLCPQCTFQHNQNEIDQLWEGAYSRA
jgi:hypothetical protein